MNSALITVSQLNRYVHSLIDGDGNLKGVYVSGEISNFKKNAFSGHIYFTLKDEQSSVKAVMFKSYADRLKFGLTEGMKAICFGSVTVYERDGAYQLYVSDIKPDGKGSIALAFEQLKQKLSAEGLFDAEHKKAIPAFPRKLAIITSKTGAAVRDMLSVTERRWPLCDIVFCPVSVQGDKAPSQMIKALNYLDKRDDIDVILLGRGGGSEEDLWCFNDEQLARTVYKMKIPVISAVGHETDFTICDFVSDLRAPTPSAAAELAVPDISDVLGNIEEKYVRLCKAQELLLHRYSEKLRYLSERRVLTDKNYFFERKQEDIDHLFLRLQSGFDKKLTLGSSKLSALMSKLDALNPAGVLKRGYTFSEKGGVTVKNVADLSENDDLTVHFADGNAYCTVKRVERT